MAATGPRHTTSHHRRALYRDAVTLIAADCGPHVTIDGVARSVASSRRQLQRSFAEVAGTTFSAHLTAARMRRAAGLLARTSASVGVIAELVGYREPSQFTKAFKRRYGMTPSDYRRRVRLAIAA